MRILALFLLLAAGDLFAGTYTTSFPVDEVPLSQGGLWTDGSITTRNKGVGVTNTGSIHFAFGLQPGTNNPPSYDDALSCLSGFNWGTTQALDFTIWCPSPPAQGHYWEVEYGLNCVLSNGWFTGYFADGAIASNDGYIELGLSYWGTNNVGLGANKYGIQYAITNGSTIHMGLTNQQITIFLNGNLVLITNDWTGTNIPAGGPLIGFFQQGYGSPFINTNFGMSYVSATDYIRNTNWYVASEAAGHGNDGMSWYNAWTNFDQIAWASVQAGDTIWVSGGPSGGTNFYVANLSDNGASRNDGTRAKPVTIKVATDSLHNGLVFQVGRIEINALYRVLDGSKTSWTPGSVMDTYRIGTNSNWQIYQTNNADGIDINGATGTRVLWLTVWQDTTPAGSDYQAINFTASGSGSAAGDGSEVAYCHVTSACGYGVLSEGGGYYLTNGYGMINVHHNLVEGCRDNYTQIFQCADVHDNIGRYPKYPKVGHPDTGQDLSAWIRWYNNIWYDCEGTGFYVEANTVLSHDVLVYNTVYYSTTNAYHDGITFTGHDGDAINNPTGSPTDWATCNISNFWFFNNTWYNLGPGQNTTVLTWNRGYRTNGLATQVHFVNNAVIQVSPYNTGPCIQLFTNKATENGIRGFDYSVSDVQIDFNSIGGGSGYGQGIIYGTHGDVFDNGYSTMAAFGTDTGYTHNNNTTATYVSLTNYDFRPGADVALKGNGTNLTSALSAIGANYTNDIRGSSRGSSWDIGAYQSDPSLVVWLSFNNSQVLDDSGNGYLPKQWSTSWGDTNLVFYTNGADGLGCYFRTNGVADPTYSRVGGTFIGITNIAGVKWTNCTISFWAKFDNNAQEAESYVLDAGYDWQFAPDQNSCSNSFRFGHTTDYYGNAQRVSMEIFYNNAGDSRGYTNLALWPQDASSGVYATTVAHLYTATIDCSNHVVIGYYDGVSNATSSISANIPWIRVYDYLCIGARHHAGALPPGSDGVPNDAWFVGWLDDVRIYNRTLAASDVAALYSGAGTSSPAQSSGGGAALIGASISLGAGVMVSSGAKVTQ